MQALEGVGNQIGEYVGDGQGEVEKMSDDPVTIDDSVVIGAEMEVDDLPVEQEEDSSDSAEPLLILYDCETTGYSMYNDHVIEIAAEVMNP